ncbi:unnamed protein product [Sphagnum troendelagicum]
MGSALARPPLLRNPYNRLRAGGWSFTASNTRHVGGQQERRRRFSVSSGEDSGRKEMEGVHSKRREPYVVSSNFSFRLSGRWARKVAHARPTLEKIPMDRKIGEVGRDDRTDADAGVRRRGLGRPGNLLIDCASPRLL